MMFRERRRGFLVLPFIFSLVFGAPPPASAQQTEEEIYVQEILFNLPLGYIITPAVLEFYNETARVTDFAWLEPDQFPLASQIARGHILFEFNTSLEPLSLSSALRARCEYFALGKNVVVSDAANLRTLANFYYKKTALAPDGDRALADNAALASVLAPYANLFVIRAEQWLEKDSSPDLTTFLGNVHAVAAAARAANPNIQLQVWLGRSAEADRLTVERLYEALSLLVLNHPRDFESFGIGRKDVWTEPQHGNNLLVQTQFFVRRRAYAGPGTPEPPRNFQAEAVGFSDILLTWTDSSADELGFLLKRSQTPGRPPSRVDGPTLRPDDNAYRDTVPSPGTYYYRLCAFNSQGLSGFSDLRAADTLGGRTNLPPRFDTPPPVFVRKGVPSDLRLGASDPDGDRLTYSLSIRPAGMVINAESGAISWLPSVAGRFLVSATVSDGRAADFLWLEIEVLDNN